MKKCPNCKAKLIVNTDGSKSCPNCQYSVSRPPKRNIPKIVQEVNELIRGIMVECALDETGVSRWKKKWVSRRKQNFKTKRKYSFLNNLWLPSDEIRYITRKQIDGYKNGKLNDNAQEFRVLSSFRLDPLPAKPNESEQDRIKRERTNRWRCMPKQKFYTVYRASDCTGLPERYPNGDEKRFPEVEDLIKDLEQRGLKYVEAGNQPQYQPATKKIAVPVIGDFESTEYFYQGFFHEVGHWIVDLLDIYKADKYKSTRYAREELVVEFFSAYICFLYGIDMIKETVEYTNGWLKNLDDDPYLLVSASAQAEKLVNWVFDNDNK